ncbi:MAG TPA: hypothetical protein VF262_00355 [Burkholderiales bacterium]
MADERTPFDSIEGSLEYLHLLREVIDKTRKTVEQDVATAEAEGAARRLQALRLVIYKLDRLAFHMDAGHRTLNDLRTLRRLFYGERQREPEAASVPALAPQAAAVQARAPEAAAAQDRAREAPRLRRRR